MRVAMDERWSPSRMDRATRTRRFGVVFALVVVIVLAGATRSAAGDATESEPSGANDMPVPHADSRSGISLPGGVWLAGDVTLSGEVPENGPAKAELDDISLLL